ncbi:kinesin-like protein KIN-12C isoform X1 [Musa acuminata AAA Group]|uniref:kinesin-like protein KIN-12C isoform X1 n=1 Tax=Musa acuminata AAA Group TaxID=214697 RepID=UPI0031D555C5
MEALRIQPPKPSARSMLSPLFPRSPSSAARKKAPPLVSRSGRENANPNVYNDPPPSPSPLLAGKASPRRADGVLRKERPRLVDELPGDDVSPDPSDPSVKVVVRVRPGNEQKRANEGAVRKISSDSLVVGGRSFTFHSVLGPESTQEDVFKTVGIPSVNYSLAGFNTSILSYGQTGTGKTYTMWGPAGAMVDGSSVNGEQGIAPRLFRMLFSEIHRKQESSEEKQINFQCRCSFLEIYNGQINDLLDPTQRNLQIRGDARNGSHVENLTDEYVTTVEDVTQLLVKGLANRKVGATSINSKSSRSHIIFTCIVESWCKLSASKCFSSSKTSKIILADLAGADDGILDAAGKQCVRERRHIKKSLSKLGKLVNILGDAEHPPEDHKVAYMGSCSTHLLQETLGGNAKVAVICAISPDGGARGGTLSTLRFGDRAKQIQNKAVVNEITEDDVNDLSDRIRQLKEELMSARLDEGKSVATADGHFKGRNGRQSLNLLRMSLNRSLILPHIDPESDEEMDVDEEDVSKLCIQLGNMNYSAENESKDKLESKDAMIIADTEGPNADQDSRTDLATVDSCGHEVNFNSSKEIRLVEMHSEVSERETANNHSATPQEGDSKITSTITCKDSLRKSGLSIPCQQRPMLQDPILCSSPKLAKILEKTSVSSESPRPNLHLESVRRSDIIRSSLQSSKASPTDSLAVSLHRGLQIINYHERNSAARSSFVGLSFEHLTNISSHSKDKVDAGMQTVLDEGTASPLLCSACKNVVDFIGYKEASETSDMQIVPVNEDVNVPLANITKREKELEALCAEQAATIKHLSCLVDKQKQEEVQAKQNVLADNCMITENHLEGSMVKCSSKEIVDHLHRDDEREALLMEIQSLKNQLKSVKDVSENNCLLEQIRNGGTSCSGIGVEEFEMEKRKWMESESRWISLTEELRLDLDKNRRFAEKKEIELNMEKNCTAELNDALQRAILGHARIVEHYVELQEKYDELLLKHRKIMEGIAEVKKAASKAGGKGSGSAFAAALAAELSTLRIDREKERAYLKEQNRRLTIQLRDTAEAVHAAGELLVRLREAEEAAALAEDKHGKAQHEVEKMRKQMEKLKRKHAMELVTMKHFLADSRLPESALKPLYHHESEIVEEGKATATDDDQSWRAAFRPSYQ